MHDPRPEEVPAPLSPPPPPPAAPRPTPPPVRPHPKENLKETVESILVAFILAFVFRAFVVEAFVIPSGSMAPTLLGGHMRFRCEECGYDWKLNYPAESLDDENLNIPSRTGGDPNDPIVFSTHCPNCGFQAQPDRVGEENSAANTPVHYGDRILVLKYLYLLQEPSRWDVVVFKSPTGSEDYAQNFIKRLVGTPGETVMLLNGDVYTHPNSIARPSPGDWTVQPKPYKVQESLWRVVYDNDFLPINEHGARRKEPWVMPWRPGLGEGWRLPESERGTRILRFENGSGSGTIAFAKDANKGTYPLTDWLPYNETKEIRLRNSSEYDLRRKLNLAYDAYGQEQIPRWYVSDLKLAFSYARLAGDGPMRASLTKLDDTFVAEFTPKSVRVIRQTPGEPERQIGPEVALAGSGPVNVEFTNVDYQVTLRINGEPVVRSTPEEYRPDVAKLLELHEKRLKVAEAGHGAETIRSVFPAPRIELTAERQTCEVSHLGLWRDVFYTPTYDNYVNSLRQGNPERPLKLLARGEGRPEQEHEYFVLGDNSILSGDGRAWTQEVHLQEEENLFVGQGKVPERFLLGKAFFVYWPAGYRPFTTEAPGLVPNFGDMRMIH